MERKEIVLTAYYVSRCLNDDNKSGPSRTNFYDVFKDIDEAAKAYKEKKSWDYYNRVAVWYPGISDPVLFSIPAAEKLRYKSANSFENFDYAQCKKIALLLE